MNYIKKSELKNLLKDKLEYKYSDFNLISSKNRLYKEIKGGLLMIDYRINDAYNFEKDEIAWRIEVSFFIGFEAVHKWFEPFEHRSKKDYKYYWTYGSNLDNILGHKTQMDVDEPNVNDFLRDVIEKVDDSFNGFYAENKDLNNLYKNKVPFTLNSIDDVKSMKTFNVRTAIEILTIAWLLRDTNFNKILHLFKYRIEELINVGDPMSKHYYPKFNEIIEALKKTNFSDSILSLQNNAA
ncbi:hypothetical protein [Winogradskyella forsetii]|uniref:hypothetical protein n=1 Tax=Winogradskyella forsetii TaxID=2686077 RepID=UPI0015BA9D36|nr:hypothetical protein [Winogradskyella forsetii]